MKNTLYIGTNASGHDSSVFLIQPKQKRVLGIATERVTRVKHDKLFFFPALEKALNNLSINPNTIQTIYLGHTFTSRESERFMSHEYEFLRAERAHFKVNFSKDLEEARNQFHNLSPIVKIRHLIRTAPGRTLLKFMVLKKLHLNSLVPIDVIILKEIKKTFPCATVIIEYFDHQQCHAVSSYYTSPFDDALVLSYDGWGDGKFSRAYVAHNGTLKAFAESTCKKIRVSNSEYPHEILGSPGGIYAYFTHLLGFKPVSEEGKVEALAASSPRHEGLYNILMSLFSVDTTNHSLSCDAERAEQTISTSLMRQIIESTPREHIAAALQAFLDDTTERYVSHLLSCSEQKNLCLSGGTTANVITNLRIFEKLTSQIHITPAMADDGAAQGAAIMLLLKHARSKKETDWLKGEAMPYYGTSYTPKNVKHAIDEFGDQIKSKNLGNGWPEYAANLLCRGKIGAIFHGRMEWGPRALGNRSIIADPRPKDFREKINKTIKKRPLFQPFCPSILAEEAPRLFENYYLNKHMTCAFRMREEYWDRLPSAIHIDGTARAQFVSKQDNENYYRILTRVKELTGYGVIINTSFNKHGRTIVETPRDAIRDFLDTDMDYVIIEGYLITRT